MIMTSSNSYSYDGAVDICRCIQLDKVNRCAHVVDWLSDHVSPMMDAGGFFWWKGTGWTYTYDPNVPGQGPDLHVVTFDEHVDAGVIMQFALIWS